MASGASLRIDGRAAKGVCWQRETSPSSTKLTRNRRLVVHGREPSAFMKSRRRIVSPGLRTTPTVTYRQAITAGIIALRNGVRRSHCTAAILIRRSHCTAAILIRRCRLGVTAVFQLGPGRVRSSFEATEQRTSRKDCSGPIAVKVVYRGSLISSRMTVLTLSK
jgi:hypothetical protein